MTAAVIVEGLRKEYGDTVAVDGVSFAVERGEIFGLLGPNGAGKTTTLEMLEGLRKPDAGSITVAGFSVRDQPLQVKERIGILLQSGMILELLTARELLELYASFYAKPLDPAVLLEQLELTDKAGTRSERLSGGQRQRLAIGLALVGNPELVFLDEPTTGLDPQARRNLWDLISAMREQGRTVMLSTHYMEEAEALCDRVAIMDHGRIIASDSPRELVREHSRQGVVEFASDEPMKDLADIAAVVEVRNDGEGMVLVSSSLPDTISGLLAAAGKQRRVVTDLRARGGTLEDVFLTLTGRSLRE